MRSRSVPEYRAFPSRQGRVSFLPYPSRAEVKDFWRSERAGWHYPALPGTNPAARYRVPPSPSAVISRHPQYLVHLPEGPVADWSDAYDLRGVTSTLDPDDRPFGLLRWKPGTGGRVVETLGEWEIPVDGCTNTALYKAFQACPGRR